MRRRFACLFVLLALAAVSRGAAAERATPPAPPPPPMPAPEAFPSLEAVEKDVARLVEASRPSVVGVIVRSSLEPLLDTLGERIRIESGPGGAPVARRLGSGVVIDPQGHIVTLASLVTGATEVFVQPSTGERLSASVKGMDEYSGLAVLVLERPGLQAGMRPIQYSDSSLLRPGSLLTSVSSPFASANGGPAYSFGFVTGTGVSQGMGRRGPYIKFNSYTSPGAGGGPVFDSKGRLAGVLFAAGDAERRERGHVIRWEVPTPPAHVEEDEDDQDDEDAETQAPPPWILKSLKRGDDPAGGIAYAVPSNIVRQVTDQIIRSGSVRRGWVGVKIEESEPGEIHLISVVPGGPAERAGLRAGDRIISINGQPAGTAGGLIETLSASSPGDRIAFGVERGGKALEVAFALAEAPEPSFDYHKAPQVWAIRMRSPVLGVDVDVDTDDEARARLGAPEGTGLVVQKVYDDTRASRAGLKAGDILLEAMGEPITGLEDLRRALRRQGQKSMEIKVLRDRKEITFQIPPELAAPAPPAAPATPPTPPSARRRPPA